MIKRDLTITVKGDESKLSDVVYFYQGDSGIVLSFEIYGLNYDFDSSSTDIVAKYRPTSCSILVKKPNNDKITIDKTNIANNTIIFKITADMIDEFSEIGTHYIQIKLYDEHDHVLTIPPIPIIVKPLISNPAITDYSLTNEGTTGEILDGTEEENYGNDLPNKIYNKRIWNPGEVIRAYDLNKMEETLNYLVKFENIKVMTSAQYDSLLEKNESILYIIIE